MTGLTVWWWDKESFSSQHFGTWRIVYAKVAPVAIFSLFTLFNTWIQCSNKQISRDIIHPWVRCRCHLYLFLLLLPLTMTTVEVVACCQYYRLWGSGIIFEGFFVLMALALLPATWFQFTIVKWCFFVRKYVALRERRVRQLIIRMDQEDAMHLIRLQHTQSAQVAQQQLDTLADQISITEDNKELYTEFTCSICISEFSPGDQVRKLVCKHYFHHDCIKLWLARQQLCPNCKINPFTGSYERIHTVEDEIAERNRRSREAARRAFNSLGLEA